MGCVQMNGTWLIICINKVLKISYLSTLHGCAILCMFYISLWRNGIISIWILRPELLAFIVFKVQIINIHASIIAEPTLYFTNYKSKWLLSFSKSRHKVQSNGFERRNISDEKSYNEGGANFGFIWYLQNGSFVS